MVLARLGRFGTAQTERRSSDVAAAGTAGNPRREITCASLAFDINHLVRQLNRADDTNELIIRS